MKKWITPAQKIIAAILLAASFAMLFFPWIGMDMDFGAYDSLEDVYEAYAEEEDISVREAREEYLSRIEDEYDNEFDWMRENDISTNLTGKDMVRLVKSYEDSALSPDDLGCIMNVYNKLMKAHLSQYGRAGSYSTSEASSQAAVSAQETNLDMILLWIVMLTTASSFAVAVWTLHGGMRGGIIFNMVVWGGLCVLTILLVGKLNDPEWIKELGTSAYLFAEDESFHITNWPFVGAALSALAYVSTYLPVGGKKKATHKPVVHTTVPVRPVGWTCSYCGTVCDNSYAFCTNCGTRRPAPRVCPSCGAKVPDGDVFCGRCGTRMPADGL